MILMRMGIDHDINMVDMALQILCQTDPPALRMEVFHRLRAAAVDHHDKIPVWPCPVRTFEQNRFAVSYIDKG